MCSVVGYIGKQKSKSIILDGLSRLEYRGYDSSGFACVTPDDHRLLYARCQGQLKNLVSKLSKQQSIDGFLGIGHTRWSTHGAASEQNAHPQFDCEKTISVVHNGIIENHHELRRQLIAQGHRFSSETDTEVIAHCFELLLAQHTTLAAAVRHLVNRLEGAYAFLAILQEYPDQMVVVRKRSPLCIGVGDGEMFVSSDVLSFAGRVKKVVFVPDETYAIVSKDKIELFSFEGESIAIEYQDLQITWDANQKLGYEHYMLKEIYEQKGALAATLKFYQNVSQTIAQHMGLTQAQFKNISHVGFVACGTSWHASMIGRFFFEKIAGVSSSVFLASEFRYMPFFPQEHMICIAVSQSGETADTLEGVRLINTYKVPTVALTNVPSSTMVREAGGFLLTQAGPEIAVASTKAFTTQLGALYWLAHRLALEKGLITVQQLEVAEQDILIAAEILESTIERYKLDITKKRASQYAQYKKAIFLGRHVSYPFALEAALKLKEISYIFAQGYPAGELKHGPIALIDAQTPIFLFSHADPLIYQKLVSNAQEVKARKGYIIAFAFDGQDELAALADELYVIPRVKPLLGPLAMAGLMQYIAYAVAKELGCPIDKPRNLAKSVTVE